MQLLPASVPLELVKIDSPGQLLTTKRGNRFVLAIIARFSTLVKVSLANVSAGTVAKSFVNNWVLVCGPPKRLFSDNLLQFTTKFIKHI